MDKSECSECKQTFQSTKEVRYPCTPCDSCRRIICNSCSGCSASEIKCLPLKTRILKFKCAKCRNYEYADILINTIKDKDQIINEKNEIIWMLKEKLKEMENNSAKQIQQKSYVDAAKTSGETNNERRNNYPNLVIKPKVKQDSIRTKSELNKNINPTELKVAVTQVKETRNGSVIISCQTKEDIDTLKEAVKQKLDDNYEIELTKMRQPRIKIVNFTQNMSADEVTKSIIEQNGIQDNIKTTYIRKTRKGCSTIYCVCSATAFQQIMVKKKLCIGWERLPIYEDLDVPRCFKCQGFYHRINDCRNKLACPNCMEEHEESNCPKQTKCCINCVTSNEKYKTSYNTQHYASDLLCPSLEYQKRILQRKTTYTPEWS